MVLIVEEEHAPVLLHFTLRFGVICTGAPA